jgi:putative ABC transport system permease protein
MLRHSLLLAVKVLGRRKGFNALRILVVTVTIGLLDVTVGALEVFVGSHPAHPDPGRFLVVSELFQSEAGGLSHAVPVRLDLLERHLPGLPGVERTTIFAPAGLLRLEQEDGFEWQPVAETDPDFFRVVQMEVLAGRPLGRPAGRREVVLTDEAAGRLFGTGAPLGRTVRWTTGEGVVVGVVRKISPEERFPSKAVAWVSRLPGPPAAGPAAPTSYSAFLLLASGARAAEVQAAFRRRLAQDPRASGLTGEPLTLAFDALRELGVHGIRGSVWPYVLTWLALMGIITLLPALSLANLALGGLQERRREIGVRRAFGASARQIALQVLIENAVLTGVGALLAGILPVIAGWCGVGSAEHLRFSGFNRLTPATWLALAGFAVMFAALSGALPAWRIARLQPLEALRGGGR